MSFAHGEGRESVLDNVNIYEQVGKEELDLYQQLTLALDLMKDDSFIVESSEVYNGIDFNVQTKYPDGLPEKVGTLFFNVDTAFDVHCEEVKSTTIDPALMNFHINIKKY